MGVEPLIALPPRVLVAGRLQCGAARAGVRRGHGECAELAHLARGSSSLFTARHAENGTFPREVGQNTILAPCPKTIMIARPVTLEKRFTVFLERVTAFCLSALSRSSQWVALQP